MKKLIILIALTFTTLGYSQAEFEKIALTENGVSTSTNKINTQEANGEVNYIDAVNLPVSTATQTALNLKANRESGVITFDGLAINADPTKFNLGSGTGYITNSLTGVTTPVSWVAQTAQTTPYLATSVATYVLKDGSGVTVLQNSYPTNEQFRTHIYLGKLAHTTFTTISFVVNDPSRSFSIAGDFHDFVNSIGSINIEGNAITPNGANLNINVSAGRTYREGANFLTNRNSPNITNEPAVNATTFRNKFRNGSGGWSAVNTTTVDPNYYDDGSGILQLVANNKFTVKVVYRFGGTGTIHMDYGQVVYDDLNAADAGIANSVASDPDTKGFASRIGWIIIKQGTTSLLTSGNYKFVAADLFGVRAATSAPAPTLQAAYNGSVTPQITTTTGGGAVAVRRGSAADTDTIIVGQNGAGTNTFSVKGNGEIYTATAATATAFTHYHGQTASDGVIRPKTLADVKTEIVTTAAIDAAKTNIVTGTGTATRIPYFSTSSELSSSNNLTFDSSVNKLNVSNSSTNTFRELFSGTSSVDPLNGSVRLSLTTPVSGFQFNAYGSTVPGSLANGTSIVSTLGTGLVLGSHSGASLKLYSNNQFITPQVTLHSSGSLLVGTTSSNGNIGRFAGTVDVNKLQLNTTPATATGTPPLLTWNSTTKDVESVPYATFAPTTSPSFTGTPTAPTATAGTNTTQIATTAFVTDGLATKEPESSRLSLNSTYIIGWGDSLTAGAGGGGTTYLSTLNFLTKFNVTNNGVGGETSTQIKNRFIANSADFDKTVIIWAGRNNFTDPVTVKADIATMVSNLTHTRYLVISVLNGNGEGVGTASYNTIIQLNNDLKVIYGEKFLDVRAYLVSLHNSSAQDLTDFANDIPPTSLRSDGIHLNAQGYTNVGEFFNKNLGILFERKGFLQSKDFKYYFETYQPLHSVGDESFTGIKTATNTGTTQLNGINLVNNGTTANARSLSITNNSTGYGSYFNNASSGYAIGGNNASSGRFLYFTNSSTGFGSYITNSSTGIGQYLNNTGNGQGVRADNTGSGYGFYSNNTGTGLGAYFLNSSTGIANVLNSTTASTGDLLQFQKNGVIKSYVNNEGEIYAETATAGTNTTQIATTAFVQNTIAKGKRYLNFNISQSFAVSANWYGKAGTGTTASTSYTAISGITDSNSFADMGKQTPHELSGLNCKISKARYHLSTNTSPRDFDVVVVTRNPAGDVWTILGTISEGTTDPYGTLTGLDTTTTVSEDNEFRVFIRNNGAVSLSLWNFNIVLELTEN